MHLLIPAILLTSASLAVAFNTGKASVRARHTRNARDKQARNPKQYNLVDHYSAQNFMDESLWSYFTGVDPTGGQTNYLVRITSTKTYNGGLFIADFAAMAHGCAVWPAYWSVGENWPDGGEIDIIEGVNLKSMNQYTLHTGQGSDCVLVKNPPTTSGSVPYTGNGSNMGCPLLDTKNTSFGHGFNMAGGGVFAHLWDDAGLKIWHFERQSIPQDIQQGQPDPSSWPTPVAFWSSLGCDFASHLHDHRLVINTALGGGWAMLIEKPDATWMINYVAVYE
ncbi:glycoside hydrolase family 16 protein [Lactarius indigo]|nr:glycoside hydrolase family 16 protein [Lactarius indigo]